MTSTTSHPTVLLIGASRGLGLAIAAEYLARGADVVATVRGPGHTLLHDLQASFPDRLRIELVDITLRHEVTVLRDRLAGHRFELLYVNAGVANEADETPADISDEEFARVMITNALSPMRVVELLGDLVPATGTIAVMSSGQGSVSRNERGGFEVYRASKSALNQLMRSYAARHREDPRTLLLMAPGWVKTGLGGPGATMTVGESIPSLVTTVDAQHGEGGLHYLDYRGATVAW